MYISVNTTTKNIFGTSWKQILVLATVKVMISVIQKIGLTDTKN
jgi:hypothetical protein